MTTVMHNFGISWQCVTSAFVPTNKVIVFDTKKLSEESFLSPSYSAGSADYLLASRGPLTVDQQIDAISQFLKKKEEHA